MSSFSGDLRRKNLGLRRALGYKSQVKTPWFTHPLLVFFFSLIALASSLFLYIRSYLQVSQAFENFLKNQKLEPTQFLQTETWINIVILSVLIAIILVGLFLVFVYYAKVIQLYKQQQNFINGFTHELKTPIASLRLFLDAFSRHEIPREDQQKYLEFMKRDIERLTDNVNQILNLAKLEDKSYESLFESIDLKSWIPQVIERFHYQYQDVELHFETMGEGPWIVEIERSLVEMALMNLVSNAITYNHSTHKKIQILLKQQRKEIIIQLSDNGEGLEKKELKNIFKKFYQIGRSAKGSGLGLYLVAQIMKLHNGKVSVDSPGPGHGSNFYLSFLKRPSLRDRK
jgi:two-component system, OmpR family, phosphate regulon sensor histidine kinase PhoR